MYKETNVLNKNTAQGCRNAIQVKHPVCRLWLNDDIQYLLKVWLQDNFRLKWFHVQPRLFSVYIIFIL